MILKIQIMQILYLCKIYIYGDFSLPKCQEPDYKSGVIQQ
jgi:hypothetical protein